MRIMKCFSYMENWYHILETIKLYVEYYQIIFVYIKTEMSYKLQLKVNDYRY